MQRAIELAHKGMNSNAGGPFGAVIVKDGKIIGEGCNQVTSTNDPTAHAEMVAIRQACNLLNSFQLDGCELYTSCEPCPMCMAAIYWSRINVVYYSYTSKDAADIGFDDQFIYEELKKDIEEREVEMKQYHTKNDVNVFQEWKNKADKIGY